MRAYLSLSTLIYIRLITLNFICIIWIFGPDIGTSSVYIKYGEMQIVIMEIHIRGGVGCYLCWLVYRYVSFISLTINLVLTRYIVG